MSEPVKATIVGDGQLYAETADGKLYPVHTDIGRLHDQDKVWVDLPADPNDYCRAVRWQR